MDAAHVSLFFWLAATSWSRFPRHNNHSSIRLLSTEWGGNGGGGRKGIAATGGAGGEPWEGAGGNAGGLWGMYTRMLSEFPILTKAITAALISAFGNLMCQLFVEKKQSVDWQRLAIFTTLAFVYIAPMLHFWFGALSCMIPAQGNTGAFMRMAADQLLFAPAFLASIMSLLLVVQVSRLP
eukprot:jgi/Chrzof1/5030/Cz15g09050.t1